MRFTFSQQGPNHILPLIEEYPEGQLVRVQGYNGIGKTLAVRLLQLATGDQPFVSMPSAWETLRSSLGTTKIVATGLKNGRSIEFTLRPSEWPERPEPVGEWLGAIESDGKRLQVAAVRSQLRVFRIAGDETLAESLAQRVQRDLEHVRQLSDQLTGRIDRWDHLVDQVEDVAGNTSPELLDRINEQLLGASERAKEIRAEHDSHKAEAEQLATVQELLDRRQQLLKRLPGIDDRLNELNSAESEVKSKLLELDQQVTDILNEQQRSKQLTSEFAKTERLIRLRKNRLQTRLWEVNQGLDSMLDPVEVFDADAPDSRTLVTRHIARLREQIADVENERLSVDLSGLVRELTDDVDEMLEQGISDGLGDESIADVDGHLLSVEELSRGIETLNAARPKPSERATELQQRFAALQNDRKAANRLATSLRLYQKALNDVAETEETLKILYERLTGAGAKSYRDLQATRSHLGDELAQISIESGELEAEREALLDAGDLAAIDESLAEIGFEDRSQERLGKLLEESAGMVAGTDDRLSEASREEREVRTELRAAETAARAAADAFRSAPDFEWLRSGDVIELPSDLSTIEARATAVASISQAAAAVARDLGALSNELGALEQALEEIARSIQSGRPGSHTRRFIEPILRRYEREFTEFLGATEIMDALFDKGTELMLDLTRMTTTWLTATGERRSRPLEAFSSGEKAFAYTRVQLEAVREQVAKNKVVFLDEFGAYVARDRLEELENFIRKRAIPDIADQLVIVLPLTQTPSDDRDRKALKERGYIVDVQA